MTRVLVAGVGNLFMGDDAFGGELARRLMRCAPVDGVDVCDFGIRTVDLFFALETTDSAVIVDIVKRDGAPGTLYVLDPAAPECSSVGIRGLGGHGPTATDLIQWCVGRAARGERPRLIRIVGCEPLDCGEDEDGHIGLSAPVEAAMQAALDLVRRIAMDLASAKGVASDEISQEAECTSSA